MLRTVAKLLGEEKVVCSMPDRIVFNVPTLAGKEFDYIREALSLLKLSGNGAFSKRCQNMIAELVGAKAALLTHSCTAALEMAAILANLGPGDEVILPSYTFTSTANAIALRGATPVFVDIRADTLNIDEALIEAAITPRTKAIFVVHYAGVSAEMDTICAIAQKHDLLIVEDAAQALFASYKGKPLGSFGALSAFSFHETKNIISGEGGALAINDPALLERSEIIWEKGTNRAQFQRGEAARYTWMDIGSSYLPSELIAAFLLAQLEKAEEITARRIHSWNRYYSAFEGLEKTGLIRRPIVPAHCSHNGHLFYLIAPNNHRRTEVLTELNDLGVNAIFHYVPLHSSPAGRSFGRTSGDLSMTDDLSARLIRLPLHASLTDEQQDRVIQASLSVFGA